jgi:tripartite-type tricarboxylate transporter receptor subunit TctC
VAKRCSQHAEGAFLPAALVRPAGSYLEYQVEPFLALHSAAERRSHSAVLERFSGVTPMKLPRRKFVLATSAAVLAAVARSARAQTYPTRSVRMVVGFPAALAPDIVARLVGQPLSERLGQPVVIENRPGAGSNIGTELIVRAPADGYALLLVTATNTFNQTLYQNLSFDFVRDIAPVAGIGRSAFAMVVNPAVPVKTVPEFIAYAKANPGKIYMASAGIGTAPHVFGALFTMLTGIEMRHVPYRGNFYSDLLSGQVHVAFVTVVSSVEYIRAAKLRPLGVTTAMRVAALAEVPPIGDFVPSYEASGWFGIGAPKDTSREIIAKLSKVTDAVIADQKMQARFADLAVEPMSMPPAEFGRFIGSETEKWAKVVKFAGIKPM